MEKEVIYTVNVISIPVVSDNKQPTIDHSYGYRNKEDALVKYYKELENVSSILSWPPHDFYVTITKTEMEVKE
ncbi:hypothetical protein [Campylobacter concisus]|jgi:hypothetical protein|uniref:hypothetical protein n=1 Tax=Campylobacter concisus TaxID=199 RepID=UPI000D3229A9|nr:hypothetical protein [Campylobacter concisus]